MNAEGTARVEHIKENGKALPWFQRFAWPFVIAGGVLSYVALLLVMVLTRNPALFPALLVVGALTTPLAVLLFAMTGRYRTLAPPSLIVMTVLVGGVVGIIGAGLLEGIAGAFGMESVLLVAIVEETVKLIVPLVVLILAYPMTAFGGVAVGVASGTGFAVLETMGFGFVALLERGGGIEAVDSVLLLRGVLAPAGHVAWTGLVCAALWGMRSWRNPALGILAVLGAYLSVIVLHAGWDTALSEGPHVLIGLLSVAALITVTLLAKRRATRTQDAVGPVAERVLSKTMDHGPTETELKQE